MKRVLVLEQQTDLNPQGGYFPDVLEAQLDKLLIIDLQQQEEIDRSMKLPVSSSIVTETPEPTTGSTFLRVNSVKTALEWAALSTADASASDDTPVDVHLTSSVAGTGVNFSRSDHRHLLPTVTLAKGGTGAATAAAARTNLEVSVAKAVALFNHAL